MNLLTQKSVYGLYVFSYKTLSNGRIKVFQNKQHRNVITLSSEEHNNVFYMIEYRRRRLYNTMSSPGLTLT